MLLKIIYLNMLVLCAFAAPPTDVVPLEKQQPTVIPILEQSEELEANGTFKYSYETANGIKREETSYDKVLPKTKGASSIEAGEDKSDESNEIHVQQGSYSYTAPDGTVITVRYIADENGFRPIGDHLPKAPSILTAASARSAGKQVKAVDNAEGGSAPAVAIALAEADDAKKSPETPKVASRIAEPSSTEQAATPVSEGSQELLTEVSTPEASATTEAAASTTVAAASTTETPTTTEAATSTTDQASSEVTSTTADQSTSEATSTPEPTESSTSIEITSTPAASTPEAASTPSSSEVTTEAVTSA